MSSRSTRFGSVGVCYGLFVCATAFCSFVCVNSAIYKPDPRIAKLLNDSWCLRNDQVSSSLRAASPVARDRTLCPSKTVIDHNRLRRPENITTVECSCDGHRCPTLGDYHCAAIQHPFSVEYKNGTSDVIHLNVACACVMARSVRVSATGHPRPS